MRNRGSRRVLMMFGLVLVTGLCFGGGRRQDQGTGGMAPSGKFPGDWKPTADYARRQDISVATVLTIEGYDYTNGDDYVKFWSNMFNVKTDVI